MSNARELAELGGSYGTGGFVGMKNRIINGAMGIWQRGTSSSTLGAFVADRWCVSAGTSVTATRSTDVPSGFPYSLSLSGTNYPQTFQRIESLNCVDLPNQSITISFWAKQTSGAGAASLALVMVAPTTPDNYVTTTAIGTTVTFTGSTSWTQYSATFTNVNSAIANGLQVLIYANTSGAATFLVTGVQLEKGSTATSFDYRPYGTELALCQRYYQKYTGLLVGSWGNSTVTYQPFLYPVKMRTTPTWNYSNIGYASSSSLGTNSATDSILRTSLTITAAGGYGYSTFDMDTSGAEL